MHPTLRSYLERQTYRISTAPAQYEQQLQSKRLGEPVLVNSGGLRATWARGEAPRVELMLSSANPRSQVGRHAWHACCRALPRNSDAAPGLARGVAGLLQAIEVDERDLASPAARAAQWAHWFPSSG